MRDYLSEMLYALTSAYSRKDYDNRQQGFPMQTNIGKLFSIFAWGLNIVHENAELVKQWDDLEQAKGAVLDRYGANWGVQRFSENDALYRLAIRVKILSQLSGGDIDTVINAAAQLFNLQPPDILLEEIFPAKIWLHINGNLLDQEHLDAAPQIIQAIKRILAAGVGICVIITVTAEETTAPLRLTPVLGCCLSTTYLPELEPEPLPPGQLVLGGAIHGCITETKLPELEETA